MKKIIFHLFIIMLPLVMSCGKESANDSLVSECCQTYTKSKIAGNFNVTYKDAENFARAHCKGEDFDIKPICSEEDTLLYVCNYEDGWMVIAGDKRYSPIVAESSKGHLSLDDAPDGLLYWFGSIAEEISILKKDFSILENDNTKVWDFFAQKADAQKAGNTKTGSMKWFAINYAPYEVGSPIENDIVPHLIGTKWGQGSPWNEKCPIDSNTSTRCYLGCTATAVAQLLNYLHNHLGKPNDLYHTISCSLTTVNGPTTNIGFSRSNLLRNSYRWANMPVNASSMPSTRIGFAGDLMLDIGNRFGMSYSGSRSGANMSSSAMSTYYEINYSSGDYSYSTVETNINNSLPVIIIAYSKRTQEGVWPFRHYSYSKGHTWLIDGLHTTTRTYEYRKRFDYSEDWYNFAEVYDSFEEIQEIYGIDDPDDEVIETYQLSTNSLLMNWGYDGNYDNAYYTTLQDGEWYANYSTHLYLRTIYYGFN